MKCPKCRYDNPGDTLFCGKCGTKFDSPPASSFTRTMETPTDDLARGTVFGGRYEIIEELGTGGMGNVYRAFDKKIDEEVALKLIKPEIAAERKTIERFRNELKTARKIRHKNVCGVFDLQEEGKTLFITMEYVRGEDLKSFLHRSKELAIGTTISIARQVAEGLAEAHKLGVVHRDLKPNNIMIDKDGQAKIMDFGIARILGAKGATGEGAIIGTPEYMSPEQVEGKEVDPRSDIYSLGIILYEMSTGRTPFEGETPFSMALKQKSEPPADPRRINPQVPEELGRLILRCLEKDRASRCPSAEAFLSDLAAVEKELLATAGFLTKKRIPSREVTIKLIPRKLFVPGLALLAVIAAGILLWRPLLRKAAFPAASAGKPSIAVLPFMNNTGDKSLDSWKSGMAQLLIDHLSQSKYIYVLPKERLLSLMKEFNLREANGFSSEDLKKLAARGIGEHILLGSIFVSGRNWQVNVTLKKADTGEDMETESIKGEGEEPPFIRIAEELAAKIKRMLPLSGRQLADDAASVLGNLTTSSPEAYDYFSQGFGFYSDIEYSKAIPLLERAVEIDPKFAMAWRVLAAIHYNSNRRDPKYKNDYRKAFDLSEGLPPRERDFIQAEYYTMVENNFDKALEILDEFLKDYPEDLLGNRTKYRILDEKQFEWEKILELVERNYRNFPENALECGNFILYLCNSGNLQRAEEVARDFLERYSNNSGIRRELSLIKVCRGQFDLALSEWEENFKRFPASHPNWSRILWKGDLSMYRGDYDKAEQEYLKFACSEVPYDKNRKIFALIVLSSVRGQFSYIRKLIDEWRKIDLKTACLYSAYLSFMKGDAQDALKNADETLKITADELEGLVYKGWAQARLKSFGEATKTADEIKRIAGDTRKIYWFHLLMGWIEIERGRYDKALAELERVIFLYPKYNIIGGGVMDDRAFMIYPLALAYHKAGDLNKAIETYQEITQLTLGRRNWGDIFIRAFYMLGKIYEQKGEKAKAIENYRKFLDLWKNADPGLPEVEDARKRLAGLTVS